MRKELEDAEAAAAKRAAEVEAKCSTLNQKFEARIQFGLCNLIELSQIPVCPISNILYSGIMPPDESR